MAEQTQVDPTRAKQLETLRIDLEFARQWIETVTALVERDLTDREFTAQRMMALGDWMRARKGASRRLSYRYDPSRRNRVLVERDTKKFIAQAREIIAARRLRLAQAAEKAARISGSTLTSPEP